MWYLVGALAACLTTFAFVPQIFKILRTKSAGDVSPVTLLQFSVGIALWIAYGVHLKDAIIIIANVISLASALLLVFLYHRYRVRK